MHQQRAPLHDALLRNTLAAAVVLGALLLGAAPAQADPEAYAIDPQHSNVGFSVAHFFSKVPGRFAKFEGTISFDAKDFSTGSVVITIDAASIDTNVPDRDKHLKSPDFFDAAKFPTIAFKSNKVTPQGPTKVQVEGTLSMKGVTKPVTLDVEFLGAGLDIWGGRRAGFEARAKINRQDFGVSWNKAIEKGGFLLGNDVDILINVEAVRKVEKAAEAPKE